jgi:hypothetical protein
VIDGEWSPYVTMLRLGNMGAATFGEPKHLLGERYRFGSACGQLTAPDLARTCGVQAGSLARTRSEKGWPRTEHLPWSLSYGVGNMGIPGVMGLPPKTKRVRPPHRGREGGHPRAEACRSMSTGSRRGLRAVLVGSRQFSSAVTAAVLVVDSIPAASARSTMPSITTIPIPVIRTSEGVSS